MLIGLVPKENGDCKGTNSFLLLGSSSHQTFFCVSRASIVQKRVIYFQDEGSLTIPLCEKGNSVLLPLFSLSYLTGIE